MASSDINLADRSGSLLESHKNYDPRIILFYFLLVALLLTLAIGLGYQQLSKTGEYRDAERQQNQRRIVVPGPRGNIYDRNHTLLVGNRPRFSVRLLLDALRPEIRREQIRIRKNYREQEEKEKPDLPSSDQLVQIARMSVVQRYLDQVNAILGRSEKVSRKDLQAHFRRELLLPYTLLDDLAPADYAKLLERLPVNSSAQVYTTSTRFYPYASAAAHTLGYVGANDDVEVEDLPGDDLKTFKMKGTVGRDGIEKKFDSLLQGEAGGAIFRVDPSGNRVNPPLKQIAPTQGKNLELSLDIELQTVAETAMGDQVGAAVALDVNTGEVLVLASKPDYDLSQFSPRVSQAVVAQLNENGGWYNHAIAAAWPPGSTFKILTAIAALRRNALTADQPIVDCKGWLRIGNTLKPCENGHKQHGEILLAEAIARSCDIYFYKAGELTTADEIAVEARRFHLDRRTGIELPNETSRMLIPDTAWKERAVGERWYPGDTANMAIGQGAVVVSPLGMACFVASVARGETVTRPTLVHQEGRPPQHTESIGLTPDQRATLLEGMEGCTKFGTAKILSTAPRYQLPGIRLAGKTGTAQKRVLKDGKIGTINYAWFICFAPIEKPEIAMAVVLEGDTLGEEFGGGGNAAPIVSLVLQKYFAKKNPPVAKPIRFKTAE